MSKKMLVRFDPKYPTKRSSDFLAPVVLEDGQIELIGLKSGKPAELGLVIMTGREVATNDVFAKLVDSGNKIPSVDQALSLLSFFIDELGKARIGDVLSFAPMQGENPSFSLIKTDYKARAPKTRGLP